MGSGNSNWDTCAVNILSAEPSPSLSAFLFHLFVFVKAFPPSLSMTSPEDKAFTK